MAFLRGVSLNSLCRLGTAHTLPVCMVPDNPGYDDTIQLKRKCIEDNKICYYVTFEKNKLTNFVILGIKKRKNKFLNNHIKKLDNDDIMNEIMDELSDNKTTNICKNV